MNINSYNFVSQVDIDFEKEPIGIGKDGKNTYFRDIWPSIQEVADVSIPQVFDEVGPKTLHIPTGDKLSVFDAASVSLYFINAFILL